MTKEFIHPLIIGIESTILLLILIYKIKVVANEFSIIVNDTLKKKDKDGVMRYSRTSLTMLTAWWACLYAFVYTLHKYGMSEWMFGIMCGVALGAKLTDAWSKKIDPTVVGPDSVTTDKITSDGSSITEEQTKTTS